MKRTYSHLNDEERRKLEQWGHAKISSDMLAEKKLKQQATHRFDQGKYSNTASERA